MSIKINNILSAFTNNLSDIKIPYNGSINNDELKYLTVKISEAWGNNNPVYAQTGNIIKNENNNILTLSSTLTDSIIEKGNKVEIEGQTTSWNIQHSEEAGSITATLFYEKDSTSNYILELTSINNAATTKDYATNSRPPWYATYGNQITSVIVQDGLVKLGKYLFADHKNLQRVSLSTTITTLYESVFQSCENLQKIELPSTISHLEANAFKGCNKLIVCAKADTQPKDWNSNWNSDNCKVIWSFSNNPTLIEGQYYRVELSNSINYGVIRYIPAPTTSLSISSGCATFIYNNILEPLLSVEFQLIDETRDIVIETSGDIYASYHQTNNYKTNMSYQFYNYFKISNNDNEYKIKVIYTTQQGYSSFLEEEANSSNILQSLTNNSLPDDIEVILDSESLNSTGVVLIKLKNKITRTTPLSYEIYKQEGINQIDIYSATKLKEGNLSNIETILYYDLNVPYGVLIKYIFVLNNIAYRIALDSYVQYEDMFLSDRSNVLKIKFNPKISNYKKFLQESKIDTIGSTYPLFSRNQIIQYKTFNIEGLIANESEIDMLANYCFSNISDYIMNHTRMATPSNENGQSLITNDINTLDPLVRERIYREKVFAWLSNGEPKLFKSPTEGNLIIRLLNVSLTPEYTLGRKFYSFSCQAVELDELNTVNCQKYGLM